MSVGIALVARRHSWDLLTQQEQIRLVEALAEIGGHVDFRVPQQMPGAVGEWDGVVKTCQALGIEVRVHQWVGTSHPVAAGPLLAGTAATTVRSAERAADALLAWGAKYDAAIIAPNIENDVVRGPRLEPGGRPTLYRLALEIITAYRERLRASDLPAEVWWLGYPSIKWHYPTFRWTPELNDSWDGVHVMAYGSTRHEVYQDVTAAGLTFPGRPRNIYVSPGRYSSSKRDAHLIGSAAVTAELVADPSCHGVSYYVGYLQGGARNGNWQPWRQLCHGHDRNPSILSQLLSFREAA